jgi:predicted PurR-regulated permease PerM
MDDSSQSDRIFIQRSVRWLIIGSATAAALLVLLWVLEAAITPLAAAFVIAYLLDPLLDRFEALRIPRALGIFLLLAAGLVVLLAFAFVLVPRMQSELLDLSQRLPGYVETLLGSLAPLLREHFGLELPGSLREGLDTLQRAGIAPQIDTVHQLLGGALRFFGGTIGSLVGLLVVPVIAVYLLVDFDRLMKQLLDAVPRNHVDSVLRRARTVDALVAGFIRGQLVVCLVLAVLYAVGFSVIGIDLALVIGFTAGLLALIPYVGGAVALVSASLMCVFQFGFGVELLMVIGWYAIVQGLEGFVLTPRIVGESLGLHPVTVIVALLVGGNLLGFLGLIVAVPVAAVIQVFAADGLAAYRESTLYTGEEEA